MERLDIYNEEGKLTGKTFVRGKDELQEGEYFVFVQACIYNLQNQLLLTRRNLNKKCGGLWEPTNGHAIAEEEPKDAIVRELCEEIGLKINDKDLKLYKTIIKGKAIRKIWYATCNVTTNDLSFVDDEVIDSKFVNEEEFKEMIDKNEIVPNNEYLLDMFNNRNKYK